MTDEQKKNLDKAVDLLQSACETIKSIADEDVCKIYEETLLTEYADLDAIGKMVRNYFELINIEQDVFSVWYYETYGEVI